MDGRVQRSKKMLYLRCLNVNHNHDLKNIFKSAATAASVRSGPWRDFYASLLAKGMKPEMARLTLARKIAAITLALWKKGERFDATQLKPQAALSVSTESRRSPREDLPAWFVGWPV